MVFSPFSTIINHHEPPWTTVKHYQPLSTTIIDHHEPLLATPLTIIGLFTRRAHDLVEASARKGMLRTNMGNVPVATGHPLGSLGTRPLQRSTGVGLIKAHAHQSAYLWARRRSRVLREETSEIKSKNASGMMFNHFELWGLRLINNTAGYCWFRFKSCPIDNGFSNRC